jgi:hypothetical protein
MRTVKRKPVSATERKSTGVLPSAGSPNPYSAGHGSGEGGGTQNVPIWERETLGRFVASSERAEQLAGQLLTLSRSRGSVVGLVIAACLHAATTARRGELVGTETHGRTVMEIAVEYGLAFAIPRRCTSESTR